MVRLASRYRCLVVFFFQAEDGIRDLIVTGVQTCALPIFTRVQDITEEALRLAFLAAPGETGGIGGLRNLVRALARTALPVVLTPGVVHLPTVPAHRKVNRVDMGTAERSEERRGGKRVDLGGRR